MTAAIDNADGSFTYNGGSSINIKKRIAIFKPRRNIREYDHGHRSGLSHSDVNAKAIYTFGDKPTHNFKFNIFGTTGKCNKKAEKNEKNSKREKKQNIRLRVKMT